jgi:dTMP kinase
MRTSRVIWPTSAATGAFGYADPVQALFITFEGAEGVGKTTQIARAAAHLRTRGVDPLVTREPGGTPLGESVRALLMAQAGEGGAPAPLAEAFLMEAARAELVTKVIAPALAAGRDVVCDRHADSTLAYQGAGRGLDPALLSTLNKVATGGLVPGLTLMFDLDPALGIERRGAAKNRFDREPLEFHRRVRARLLELAAAEPSRFVVLDAGAAPEAVEARVWEAVEARLGG